MARTKTPAKRLRVSEPNETDADDGKLVDLTSCDAADDEPAVKAKVFVHGYWKDTLFSTENGTSEFLYPAYSDLSIICGDNVFPAHRIIGEKREIEINDRDATLVEKMLQFVYTGDCTCDIPPETEESETEMHLSPTADAEEEIAPVIALASHFHAQMYAQGDYFQIEGLKAKAKEYFEKTFLNTLEKDPFVRAVISVYTSTAENDRGLRDIVVQLTRNNLRNLRNRRNPILSSHLLQLIPQFMLDICVSTMDECARYQKHSPAWAKQQSHFWDSRE